MRGPQPELLSPTGLYGREQELSVLHEALRCAAAGETCTVLVVGEPGIGKSRLCRAFGDHASARGAAVVWGRAWEAGGAPPFWPWIEALRTLLDRGLVDLAALGAERLLALAQLVPEFAPNAAALPPLDPDAARFRLFDAVGACLKHASRERSLVLALDDLHAADSGSLLLLHFVARSVREAKLLLLGAYRDVEARLSGPAGEALAKVARDGRYLALSRLSQQDVRAWALAASSPLFETLWTRTEGNPLFIVETLRLQAAQGDRAQPGIPDVAREVIRTRLRELSPHARSLLEAAAVFGRRADLNLACRVAGVERVAALESWREALRAEVLAEVDSGVGEFTHVLLRDALYEAVPAAQRAELHKRALAVLAPNGPRHTAGALSEAVHHALQAVPALPADEAVDWARAAATRAVSALAYDLATDWLERALTLLPEDAARERCDVWLELADAQVGAGRSASALESSRNAAALARTLGDPRRLAEAALSYGKLYALASVPAELIGLLEEASAALPNHEDGLRARLLARLASALQPARDPQPPMAIARTALTLARGLADPRTELEVAFAAGSALGYFAPPEERAQVSLRVIEIADQLGDRARGLRGRARLAMDLLEQGDMALAEHCVGEYERIANAIDVPSLGWIGHALTASVDLVRGRFEDAERQMLLAGALAQRIDDLNAPLTLGMQRVALLRASGRHAELRQEAPAVIERLCARADRWYAHAFAAGVCASAGMLDEARSMLASVTLDLEGMRGRGSLTFAAEACVVVGDAELCARIFEMLLVLEDHNHSWGMPALVCEAPIAHTLGRLAGRLGNRAEALRLFDKAEARAQRMQAVTWQAQIARDRAALEPELGASPGRAESIPAPAFPPFSMELCGEVWTIRASAEIRLKDSRGLRILARLVEHPGCEFHVTDLLAPAGEAGYVTDSGDALDAEAIARYRARLEDLREVERESEALNDPTRAERVRTEIEAIAQELSRAVGLGGRARRAGSSSEKARVNVRQRVRNAIDKLDEHDPALAQHLRWAVRTGTFCAYDPKRR